MSRLGGYVQMAGAMLPATSNYRRDTHKGGYMNILHAAENFLVAELPSVEEGVRLLLTKVGDQVLLHRQAQGSQTTSTALPMEVIDAIYSAVHTAQ